MRDDLDQSLRPFCGYNIKRAFSVFQSDLNATLRPFGLRMLSYSVLSVVSSHAGIRQSQLADALALERPNIVQLIDELEQLGWIVRNRDPGDRRAWIVSSTAEGRKLYRAATAAVQRHEKRLTAGLTVAEQDNLVRTLRVIEANGRKGNCRENAAL